MKFHAALDDAVQRFCSLLGRYGQWPAMLDKVGSLVCPAFTDPLLLPAAVGNLSPLSRPMFMSVRGEPGTFNASPGPNASSTPNGGDPGDPPHSTSACAPLKFHGMHGAPCNLNLGGLNDENTICPFGSTVGLWWRFNVKGLGNVYYIDCCGRNITWKVWCRWASEPNWCAGAGSNIYTCTLTVLQKDMHPAGPTGFADPSFFERSGPPGPGE
jgi:hypothetical protein